MIKWCPRSDTESTLKPNLRYAKSAYKLLTLTPNSNLLIECFFFKKCELANIPSPACLYFYFQILQAIFLSNYNVFENR